VRWRTVLPAAKPPRLHPRKPPPCFRLSSGGDLPLLAVLRFVSQGVVGNSFIILWTSPSASLDSWASAGNSRRAPDVRTIFAECVLADFALTFRPGSRDAPAISEQPGEGRAARRMATARLREKEGFAATWMICLRRGRMAPSAAPGRSLDSALITVGGNTKGTALLTEGGDARHDGVTTR